MQTQKGRKSLKLLFHFSWDELHQLISSNSESVSKNVFSIIKISFLTTILMSGVARNKSDQNNKLSLVSFLVGVSGHQAYYAAGNFHCKCVEALWVLLACWVSLAAHTEYDTLHEKDPVAQNWRSKPDEVTAKWSRKQIEVEMSCRHHLFIALSHTEEHWEHVRII